MTDNPLMAALQQFARRRDALALWEAAAHPAIGWGGMLQPILRKGGSEGAGDTSADLLSGLGGVEAVDVVFSIEKGGREMTTEAQSKHGDPAKGQFFNNGEYAREIRTGGTFPPEARGPSLPNTDGARTDTPLAQAPFRLVLGG
jgi:hypothetical protein